MRPSIRKIARLAVAFFLTSIVSPGAGEARWWKGNLHTHSLWSDGDDYPEMITDWYKKNGYHFLAISDHNILAEGEHWIHQSKNAGGQRAFEKYLKRFGSDWVEQKVEKGNPQVRLKTFAEYRKLFDEPDLFLLVQSEEITAQFQGIPVHVNATNLQKFISPQGGTSVGNVMQNNVDAVLRQRRETGKPIVPHINHPNFGWAMKPADFINLRGEKFFEIHNGHPAVRNEGDDLHLSIEELWDVVLAYRIAVLGLPPLYGLATDDAHNYHDLAVGQSNTGRGWIMVRAKNLSIGAIIASMEQGNFYASSGVRLEEVRVDERNIRIKIKPEPEATYLTRFIGTRSAFTQTKNIDQYNALHPEQRGIGIVLAESRSFEPSYSFRGDEIYVRAVVISSKKKDNPYREGEFEKAWTQPALNLK